MVKYYIQINQNLKKIIKLNIRQYLFFYKGTKNKESRSGCLPQLLDILVLTCGDVGVFKVCVLTVNGTDWILHCACLLFDTQSFGIFPRGREEGKSHYSRSGSESKVKVEQVYRAEYCSTCTKHCFQFLFLCIWHTLNARLR